MWAKAGVTPARDSGAPADRRGKQSHFTHIQLSLLSIFEFSFVKLLRSKCFQLNELRQKYSTLSLTPLLLYIL